MSDHSNKSDTAPVEESFGLDNPDVVTKYQTAATIANKALGATLAAIKEGAEIFDLCKIGDDVILEETDKVYNKRVKKGDKKEKDDKKDEGEKISKGIGFPTCISVNEIAGNFSPLKGESKPIRGGQLVKVCLGVQIDGFIAQAAHTVLVPSGESPTEKVSDRRADVLKATWTAAEAAVRLMQPGNKNTQVTQILQKCAEEFKCQPVAGVLSHEVKRHVIDGSNCILGRETDTDKVEEFEFKEGQAFSLDVVLSSGEGKLREQEGKHTVYKRAHEHKYVLKTAKARQFISEVDKKYPSLPFSLRNIEDEQCARVGVSEARRHQLLNEYPVLTERPGEFVAQFKCTVLLLPGGLKKITGLDFDQGALIESPYQVEDAALKELLAKSLAPRKKRNKKSKDDKKDDA